MLNELGRVRRWLAVAAACSVGLSAFQALAQPLPGGPRGGQGALGAGASEAKLREFLGTLKPPVAPSALESGQSLKLALPDIAVSGPVKVQMASELPRTEAMWLLTLDPHPDGGSTLLASVSLTSSVAARTELTVNLFKSQHLMLLVRAGGKYHSVHRHIKIGTPANERDQK